MSNLFGLDLTARTNKKAEKAAKRTVAQLDQLRSRVAELERDKADLISELRATRQVLKVERTRVPRVRVSAALPEGTIELRGTKGERVVLSGLLP